MILVIVVFGGMLFLFWNLVDYNELWKIIIWFIVFGLIGLVVVLGVVVYGLVIIWVVYD